MTLTRAFYERAAPRVARALLGCLLVARRGRLVTTGRIVETEAYLGPEDGASHAAFRPGSREIFYGPGGVAYVFRVYGVHDCLNAITGREGTPGCVLIRALEPVTGAAVMARRRGLGPDASRPASGPGNVTRALGVTRSENGIDLTRGALTIEPRRGPLRGRVTTGRRVGISRCPHLPLRFWIAGNRYVSR